MNSLARLRVALRLALADALHLIQNFARIDTGGPDMNLEGVPESIDRQVVMDFLDSLGIDPARVTRTSGVRIDAHGVWCSVLAHDENGERFTLNGVDPATHLIAIPYADEQESP